MASQEIRVLFHGSRIVLVDGADSTGVRKGFDRLIGRMDRDRSAASGQPRIARSTTIEAQSFWGLLQVEVRLANHRHQVTPV